MALDPYDACPCGSGKKFKWCCQPIHVLVSKAFQQDAEGQHEAALRTMDEVAAQNPGNPEVWGRKAQLLYQMDKVEEAETTLQKAFEINPDYAFGHFLRGKFRQFEGEIKGALLEFRKAAERYDPQARELLAQIQMHIADCELKMNRPVAARAAVEMAARLAPNQPEVRQSLEPLFGKDSRLPECARREYRFEPLAASAAPAQRAAWDMALAQAATGKLEDAARAFEQFIKDQGDAAAAKYNLGLVRAWQGNNQAALETLESYVNLEPDEGKAAAAWALAEVLRCGQGMEEQADYVEHYAVMPLRNPQSFVHVLQGLERERLLIGVQVNQEEGMLSGILLEKVQTLTPEMAARATPRLAASLLMVGPMVRLWNVNRKGLDEALEEIQKRAGAALGEAQIFRGPAHFTDILSEGVVFPLNAADEAEGKSRMADACARYLEEQWVHRPLQSLNQIPPVDAAGHAPLRKKLCGVILFLQDCAAAGGVAYDFDRLRRKLGLLGAAPAATGELDVSAMSAAELAALSIDSLTDDQIEQAYQAALKLDARDLAGQFARAIVSRPPRPDKADRFPYFLHLIQLALAEGHTDLALDHVNAGEKADCENNEGRRRNDYELRRGQIHARRGEIETAQNVFDSLIARVPGDLRFRGSAAEAMLSAKDTVRALHFAEAGLEQARKQNDRDMENYFKELAAAARK
jgi:tetratricopeptide (TPR) repeat protein